MKETGVIGTITCTMLQPKILTLLEKDLKSLEEDLIKLLQWLSDNRINASNDKCYLLVSGKERVTKNVNGFKIENTVYC